MSESGVIALSVVMPAYNEEEAIERAVHEVRELVLDTVVGSELVVVDDGSRDATGEILDEVAGADSRVRVIHQPNGGHGRALLTGLGQARGEYVFLIDSDRQIPLEAFRALWEQAQNRDGVIGVRSDRHDPAVRIVLSKFIRAVIRALFGARLRDPNVPFKVVRRSVWLEAREAIPEDALAPSLFLAIFMSAKGRNVAELDVPHRKRETGTVSLRHWRLFKFCARGFRQLLSFRRRMTQ